MTPRANEIKFRANGLGGGESPAETSCPVCGVGPQPSCGPEWERWGWPGFLRFWNYRQEAWGLEEGPGQSWWGGGSAFLGGEIKHLGKQVLRTLLGPSAETAQRVSPWDPSQCCSWSSEEELPVLGEHPACLEGQDSPGCSIRRGRDTEGRGRERTPGGGGGPGRTGTSGGAGRGHAGGRGPTQAWRQEW